MLRLRWAARDVRRRWLLVATIAAVIAIGTGMFTGLGGTGRWRTQSNDASYSLLAAHDLKVELPPGVTVARGSLVARIRSIRDAGDVGDTSERLVIGTQVDASTSRHTVLVPGRIVGSAPGGGGVDRVHVFDGRAPSSGQQAVILESKFASFHDLPAAGTLKLGTQQTVRYSGVGVSPEYFMVVNEAAGLLGHASFAVLFSSLAEAQRLAGVGDVVNEVAVRVHPGVDRAAVRREIAAVVAPIAGTVSDRDDDPVRRALYQDAENDQQVWDLFAFVILAAAGLASFNLVSRIVEAERREIGVGMALGVPPRSLATRHLLVGFQVALLGTAAGLGLGVLTAAAMRSVYSSVLPLPVWRTPLPLDRFALGAGLGVVVPMIASTIPVWRAVRVEPVEAIRSGAYAAASNRSGLAPVTRRLRRRGSVLRQLPVRNALRAPRRTVLTGLGVAGAIAGLVVVLGALDSFLGTIDSASLELSRSAPQRLTVDLDHLRLADSDVVRDIKARPEVGRVDTNIIVSGALRANGTSFDVIPQLLDLREGMWVPTIEDRAGSLIDGVVISQKAAHDLGVRPGDSVTLRHPRRVGTTSFALADSRFRVVGLHRLPLRSLVLMDRSIAPAFGLEGLTNRLNIVPAQGVSQAQLQRALFGAEGVASTQPILATVRFLRDQISSYINIFRIIEIGTLVLALLIATNSASISVEERAREEATMFAFGVPLRSVLLTLSAESALIGILGTAIGGGVGLLILRWMMQTLFPETMPDLAIRTVLSGGSRALVAFLGIGAVSIAPLLLSRRLARMDIPSTLRVLE
jgi:putative ABC transport system permease protein